MNKIKYFFKKHLFLIVFLVVSASFLSAYLVWAYNPGTNIRICTDSVDQPACYSSAYPTPTLNWYKDSGTSDQEAYQVQVDNNSDYSSPEIDSGTVVSTDESYTVNSAGLAFNTNYYWRVRVRDNFDSWTNYAQGTDTLFTTADSCNSSPTASNLSVSQGDYCVLPSHRFTWDYSDPEGDPQEKYQLQVDNNSNFSSPEVDIAPVSSSAEEVVVVVSTSPGEDQLAYNTGYYWRVRVWDDQGGDSGWLNGPSFTTEPHRYPSIDFDWTPDGPNINEGVQFVDQSSVYGGTTKASWSWTFPDGDPGTSNQQNPLVIFTSSGSKSVSLTVTDSDGFSCPGSETVNVGFSLPEWEESSP